MENYIVSARKYRPLTFDAVVGQEAITSTLKNAIKNDHLAHAYLFCGPRGVGKTTVARIFAKTINCQQVTDRVEPCNECESCKAFSESRSYNIHELDAASNNSVDDIRNLTDQIRIPPQIGRYSVYIIDEVHMLSASAFNAFLKTLEEPPAHAIFILATTEKQKIIPTILSRCQIFDFNRIKVNDMVEYMQFVAKEEKIKADPDALTVIANKADGAMRDALSIFDQMVNFAGTSFGYKEVIENLNVLDYDYYFRITEAFLQNNLIESLMIFNEILENGFDGHHFITGLSSHFRDLLVCKDPVTVQLLEVGATIAENYLKQSKHCPVDFLYRALDICTATDISYKNSNNQRLHVELALFKMCQITGKIEIPDKPAQKTTKPEEKIEPEQKDLPSPKDEQIETKEDAIEEAESDNETEEEETITKEEDDRVEKETVVEDDSIEEEKVIEDEPDEIPEDDVIHEEREPEPYRPATTSIKNALSGLHKADNGGGESEYETPDQPAEGITKKPFDSDTLIGKWQTFADSIKSKKPRLSSTLKTQLPVLGDNFQIEVEMDNQAQKEDFDKAIKADLLGFLRKELQNDTIQINAFVVEEENNKNSLYTDEEKFNHLNQINPNLGKLKQQFNLDFD